MIYLGVDPGLKGAIAVIRDDGTKDIVPMPDGKGYPEPLLFVNELRRIIDGQRFAAAVEQTHTRPGQGIVAAHSYGIGFGVILGSLYAFGPIEIRTVRPQQWQQYFWSHYGAHGTDTKQRTYQANLRAHPEVAGKLTTIKGTLLDGNSDALGLATWLFDTTSLRNRMP